MGAERRVAKNRGKESGQSALEFLLVLPVIVGLTVILIRVNSAIQVSIVEQKYARMTAHQFTFRSPKFPERARRWGSGTLKRFVTNQWVVGIQEEATAGSNIFPKASEIKILKRGPAREPQRYPTDAGAPEVLVRNTVTICTAPTALQAGIAPKDLAENSKVAFCKGAFE